MENRYEMFLNYKPDSLAFPRGFYLDYSKKVVKTLMSKEHILGDYLKAPFILKHSTGNYPKNDEINEPIVYADYYFLETLLRLKSL